MQSSTAQAPALIVRPPRGRRGDLKLSGVVAALLTVPGVADQGPTFMVAIGGRQIEARLCRRLVEQDVAVFDGDRVALFVNPDAIRLSVIVGVSRGAERLRG